ncbi:MAG TPA: hypothetical protein VD864_00820 [Nocardioides sp.]|nr:hypothetical protein [Nocardioides sp.]
MRYAVETPQSAEEVPGGLLQVANVIDGAPGQVFHQGVQIEPRFEGQVRRYVDGSKTFDKPKDSIEAAPFTLYAGVDLPLLMQHNEAEPTVKDVFGRGEDRAVEAALQELVLNPAAVDLTPTPGTAVTNTRLALGLLEQYAASQYSGVPTLHTNRLGGNLMTEFADADNGNLKTRLGVRIAVGAGYSATGPSVAPAGTAWLYATGQVTLWRSALRTYPAVAAEDNREKALAEARYVPTVEAFVAAILIGA